MQEQNLPTPVGAENLPKSVEVANPQQGETQQTKTPEVSQTQERAPATGDVAVQAAPMMPATEKIR
jgi:hypothetical protein